jgi:CRISPR-associated endonuclease/helicase Cas3
LVQSEDEIEKSFKDFFKTATGDGKGANGHDPYPFQKRLATCDRLPELIDIPTGLGKTDAVVLAWLWRRRFAGPQVRAATPRRLVYCLPMRVLVEQTAKKASEWLENLGMLAEAPGDDKPFASDQLAAKCGVEGKRIAVTVLMGGEDKKKMGDWDLYPERDAILIGTQDMLLSRALNRGYGMSRYRWPMHFGLLNNDCLWVMDEVQLMGRGFTTSVQMQAFRDLLGTMGPSDIKTIWMSATLEREWLNIVDYIQQTGNSTAFALEQEDLDFSGIKSRISAVKTLRKTSAGAGDSKALAEAILQKHKPDTRTLIVQNTVKRAVDLHSALKKMNKDVNLILVHSRFRPLDRKNVVSELRKKPYAGGTIVVSTQVVEAGVDISSKTMFTELAPWPSLVRRFGRCNRSGEFGDSEVYWIDVPTGEESLASPYVDKELDEARMILDSHDGNSVGPASLPDVPIPFDHEQMIRRKDLLELFDTTPDLAGHDLDISRFIRESSDTDVQVFWRDVPEKGLDDSEPRPHRNELCSVPLADINDLVRKGAKAWIWDSLEGSWTPVNRVTPIVPGTIFMLRSADGRYTPAEGWNIQSREPVPVVPIERIVDEGYDDNLTSSGDWQSIAGHTDAVSQEMIRVLDLLGLEDDWR